MRMEGQPMSAEVRQPLGDEFPRAAAHALGYIGALAALPLLAEPLPWHKSLAVASLLLALVLLLRAYLSMAVRQALSPRRSGAVLMWTDLGALFLLIASAWAVFAVHAARQSDGWAAFLGLWALAALVCSLRLLARARHTWFSETFLSRME
jgi:predicted membrane channel-forming protein YqfA (hemolysin III family)